jgi:hypothetical protein
MAFTRPVSVEEKLAYCIHRVFLTWLSSRHGAASSQAPPDGMQQIIWSFSRTPPESADKESHLSIHHRFGSGVLNLTRTTAPVSEGEGEDAPLPSPVPSAEAGDGGGEEDKDEVDLDVGNTTRPTDAASAIGGGGRGFSSFVHAGLCILAFLIVIPSGALVVRYAKATGSSAAFTLHQNLQFGVGAFPIFGFVAFANFPDLFSTLFSFITDCMSNFVSFLKNLLQLVRPLPGARSRIFSWTAMALGQRTK